MTLRQFDPFRVTVPPVRKFPYRRTYTPPLLVNVESELPLAGPAMRSLKKRTGAGVCCPKAVVAANKQVRSVSLNLTVVFLPFR